MFPHKNGETFQSSTSPSYYDVIDENGDQNVSDSTFENPLLIAVFVVCVVILILTISNCTRNRFECFQLHRHMRRLNFLKFWQNTNSSRSHGHQTEAYTVDSVQINTDGLRSIQQDVSMRQCKFWCRNATTHSAGRESVVDRFE